jgi:hypothetical protein
MELVKIQSLYYYADGVKPKPYFRGKLHYLCVYIYISIMILLQIYDFCLLSLGVGFKTVTYFASAIYHVYPFCTVKNMERAFWCDIFFIPFAIIGNIIPIIEKNTQSHVILALSIIITNGIVIRTHGGSMSTFKSKNTKDIIRGVIIISYTLWVLKCLGEAMLWDIWWYTIFMLSLFSLILWIPVTNSGDKEPLSHYIPWHKNKIWGYHEDFHVVLICIDIVWFVRMYILLN